MERVGEMRDVNRYYDFIYLWSQVIGRFRTFSATGAYAIHRPLLDADSGEYSDRVIHGLLAEIAADIGLIDALDAGCGYGGSCLDLAGRLGGRWLGVTTNRRQHRIALRNARAMGLGGTVDFALASYDMPLPRAFSFIFGIESLIHSRDPLRTIANLAGHLQPQGYLVIVDDMLVKPLAPRFHSDVEAFKRLWRCPVMPAIGEWARHLESAGCSVEDVRDLSHLMWPRTEAELTAEIASLSRRHWRDMVGLRMVSEAQKGGLILERLTVAGASRYIMMTARKR